MKYLLISACSGILMALSWPTNSNLTYLLFIGLVPLLWSIKIWIEENKGGKKYIIFFSFYISFIIWNAISVWWLHNTHRPNGSYSWESYVLPVSFNSLLMSLILYLYIFLNIKLNKFLSQTFLIFSWILFEKLHFEWEFTWP